MCLAALERSGALFTSPVLEDPVLCPSPASLSSRSSLADDPSMACSSFPFTRSAR